MTAAEFEAERQHRERERHEAWWGHVEYDPRYDDPYYPSRDERRE